VVCQRQKIRKRLNKIKIFYRNLLTLSSQFVTIPKKMMLLFRNPDLSRLTNLINEDMFFEPLLNPKKLERDDE
jgi:hypothetical protein